MKSSRSYARILLPALFAAMLLSAGCFGSSQEPLPDPEVVRKELVGKQWTCEAIFRRDIEGDNPPVIEFLPDGTVKGTGGCNSFSGTYTLLAEGISFGPLAVTKKACPGGLGEQEHTFLTFLKTIERFKVDGDELELYATKYDSPMAFTADSGGFLW